MRSSIRITVHGLKRLHVGGGREQGRDLTRVISPSTHVRLGGLLYVVSVVQFYVGFVVTALHYGPPGYDPLNDSISDLQAVHCGDFQGAYVCSPFHLVANASVIVLGLFLLLGTLLSRPGLPKHGSMLAGSGLLIIAAVGAIANGFTPEDVTATGDALTALVAFLGANLGLIQIGRMMSEDPRWRGFSLYSMISGIVGLLALVLYLAGIVGVNGSGLIEWIIVVPVTVWMLVVGIRIVYASPAETHSSSGQ
jgi:hypothetical membrane protein